MPNICMHLYYPPAPVFMTNITVILPLFMWFFEWLSSPRDCKVYAMSIIVFACHIVDVHWMNEWNAASNLTFAVRNSGQNTQPGEPHKACVVSTQVYALLDLSHSKVHFRSPHFYLPFDSQILSHYSLPEPMAGIINQSQCSLSLSFFLLFSLSLSFFYWVWWWL